MINRNKISQSFDHKKINTKKNKLSSWINDYEIQAYATQEMKKEIKELLLDVYDDDKDIRDHFLDKYVNNFSEILNVKSNPKDIDSIYKEEIPYNIPEKSEFKKFIENRNKLLKKENNLKKNYSNYWSENKNIKCDLYDFDDDQNEKKLKRRSLSKTDCINDKKRNNSKVRDYAKSRYQTLNKYDDIFSNNNDDDNTKIKVNKKKISKDYYYKNNNKYDKKRFKKNPSFINFRHSNINKSIIENDKNTKKSMENNISLLLSKYNNYNDKKQKDKKEIKVYSRKNKYLNKEKKINNNRYNLNNNISLEKNIELDKGKLINEIDIDSKIINNNLDNYKGFNRDISDYNDDDSSKSYHIFTDEYLEENGDEIKKINIKGVNYRITGEPKKYEISEEILLDKNNIKDINKKNEKDEPNKESNLIHKKLIIKKNIDDKDKKVSLVQKIEKDIKQSKTRISNISKESLNKLMRLYNNDNKSNDSYIITYYKENEIFGINPFSYIDNENDKQNDDEKNKKRFIYKPYNERRKDRKKNIYSNNKIIYENKNNVNKDIENKINNINEDKEIKVNKKDIINNYKDYLYNNNNRNQNNEIKFEKIKNNIENQIEEIKTYDNSTKTNLNGNKRKRFHRLINSDL